MLKLREKEKIDKSLTAEQRTKIALEKIELQKIKEKNKLNGPYKASAIATITGIIGAATIIIGLIIAGTISSIHRRNIEKELILRGYVKLESRYNDVPIYKKVD